MNDTEPVAELVSWPNDRTPMAWIGRVDLPEGTKAYLHAEPQHPDCNQCANRGKVYAMSQESSCDHCVWQQAGWRKNLFLKKDN